jgi:hypothetical protein
MMRA